jgi:hypothetical protein
MSDKPVPTLHQGILTEEQVAKINGGDCTVQDWIGVLSDLKSTYENLIDFTSYVIERVGGP